LVISVMLYCLLSYILSANVTLTSSFGGLPPFRPRTLALSSPAFGVFANHITFRFGQSGENGEHARHNG
jgi:hypothetical protein